MTSVTPKPRAGDNNAELHGVAEVVRLRLLVEDLREREWELVELLKAVEFTTVVADKCPVCLGWDSKWGEQARKHTKTCKLAAALAKHGR